ncbi:hypothetical protein AM493_15785 [Flavobacterium akiainvivens]|uniref:2'-5' RNA ligase n=1 Tax=Flavobacterium akiainvivens TaxID=1202724 RepID=A0A0M9VJ44_9FLAO|nr:2'-5' RNA ligase family protein [Flavobacterium akiainvivens]KOS07336.1 hypothetical protein AM493_15785 [Flavobacterium akiainvivens]SFQ46833.1 2'-5' RNA ligase [Flavobacterium akiainvivens]
MQSQNLYFLAIIPNGKTAGEVTALKEHMALHYNSRKALRVMPHITLKAPFTALQDKVVGWFEHLNLKTTPFLQTLDGFGAFANKHNPVIYVKPVASAHLTALQGEITASFKHTFPEVALQPTEEQFSPHMTIGYRDLSFEMFEKAWAEFESKNYHAEFEVNEVFLLEHDGKKWNSIAQKPLQ